MTFWLVSILSTIINFNPFDWIFTLINDIAHIALAQFQQRLFMMFGGQKTIDEVESIYNGDDQVAEESNSWRLAKNIIYMRGANSITPEMSKICLAIGILLFSLIAAFMFICCDSKVSRKIFAFSLIVSSVLELITTQGRNKNEIFAAFLSFYWAYQTNKLAKVVDYEIEQKVTQ